MTKVGTSNSDRTISLTAVRSEEVVMGSNQPLTGIIIWGITSEVKAVGA